MRHFVSTMFFIILSVSAVYTISCAPKKETISIQVGTEEYIVEVAKTREERAEGLMFRKELKKRHGMLFIFPHDQKLSFWMKDTSIPLSIAFISKNGTIKEILDMTPFSEKPVPSTYSVRYALEVNKGEFQKLGIQVGDKVMIPENL